MTNERMIDRARDEYANGTITLAEFERLVDDALNAEPTFGALTTHK